MLDASPQEGLPTQPSTPDNLCHPAEKLYKDYLGAVKYENIFSVNVGPNYEGRIRDIDVKTLKQVGEKIKAGVTTQPENPPDKK